MASLRPTLEYRRGDELITYAVASPEAVWFQGHFPKEPLLPGVALLSLVEESIGLFWQDRTIVESFRRIRFRLRVGPGQGLRARIRRVEAGRFRFTVEAGGQPACTGECSAAPSVTAKPAAGMVLPAFLRPEMGGTRFCSDGTTLGEVWARASSLCDRGGRVCVASDDRVEVAAALVAALCGGIEAVFPPGLLAEAMLATYRAKPFASWLGPAEFSSRVPELASLRIEVVAGAQRALVLSPADEPRVGLQTGGTTGEPRLWPKTGRNLLEEVALHAHGLQVGSDDHILATVPPHHIYGLLFSVLLPLAAGASVSRFSPFFPEEIGEQIARTSATILVSTPAHLRALATSLPVQHRLRLVLSSGAPLSAADAAAFAERAGLWPLEIYGSTETGGIAVRRQDVADCPWALLAGVDCRMDGEALAVRSAYVSPGVSMSADGFFTTADVASLRDDGRFDLFGRSDGIIKVGGQRVALPEVERAIAGLDQVAEAVVLALPSRSGRGQEIVALVASPRPAEAIARELRERLPSPAWPRRLRCVEVIPITASGKRDRTAILRLLDAAEDAAE